MDQWSVFVSSVITGFSAERTAVRRAVANLRHTPIMAEDFGASSTTPQTACMEQVRQSHVYIGIFGERYGDRGASGLAPTEEKYREAKKRGLEVLCFVSKGALDDDQQQFVDSIKGYEHGRLIAFYESANELKDEITRALNDLSRARAGSGIDAKQARSKFELKLDPRERRGQGEPECRLAIIPERQVDEYLSPHDLGSERLRERIERQLLYGPKPRLFDRTKGIHILDGEDFICLWQGDGEFQSAYATLSLYSDGAIILTTSLTTSRSQEDFPYSLVREYVVDEAAVSRILEGFFGFCENVYSSEDSFQQASSFFAWLQLASVQQRMFGQIPTPEPSSFHIPMHSLDDPVCIQAEPQQLVRKQLLDPRPNLGPGFVRALPYLRLSQGVTCRTWAYLTQIAPM